MIVPSRRLNKRTTVLNYIVYFNKWKKKMSSSVFSVCVAITSAVLWKVRFQSHVTFDSVVVPVGFSITFIAVVFSFLHRTVRSKWAYSIVIKLCQAWLKLRFHFLPLSAHPKLACSFIQLGCLWNATVFAVVMCSLCFRVLPLLTPPQWGEKVFWVPL